MTYSLGGHLLFPRTLPVKSCHTNSKFEGAFLPPVSGVDSADQAQNKT